MLRMSRRRRMFAFVWAVLQFALPALGALAEGAVADSAASAAPTGHVEESSGPGCRPVHAPDCARCQGLSTHAAPPPPASVDWTHAASHTAPAVNAVDRRGTGLRALPLSRAPPRVS